MATIRVYDPDTKRVSKVNHPYSTPEAAVRDLVWAHPDAIYFLDEEDAAYFWAPIDVEYQVWVREQGHEASPQGREYAHANASVVQDWARDFNAEETALARLEQRDVRRVFFAVKATTTYREI